MAWLDIYILRVTVDYYLESSLAFIDILDSNCCQIVFISFFTWIQDKNYVIIIHSDIYYAKLQLCNGSILRLQLPSSW